VEAERLPTGAGLPSSTVSAAEAGPDIGSIHMVRTTCTSKSDCEKEMNTRSQARRGVEVCFAGVMLILAGCTLPFPGPYQGTVTDSTTGNPLDGARWKQSGGATTTRSPMVPGASSFALLPSPMNEGPFG